MLSALSVTIRRSIASVARHVAEFDQVSALDQAETRPLPQRAIPQQQIRRENPNRHHKAPGVETFASALGGGGAHVPPASAAAFGCRC
jgi:hypothetical protein